MTGHDSATDGPAPDAATAKRPGRARRLLRGAFRWTRRIVVVVALVVVVARASMGLWLPRVVDAVTHPMGLDVAWQDLDLSILGVSADVTGLRVVALEDENGERRDEAALAAARPIARLDDIGFDVDVSGLLAGERRIHRVEVSGLEAWIERDADGTWSFERFLPAPAEQGEESADDVASEDAEPADAEASEEADFTPPVELTSLSVSGVRVHLVDRTCDLDTALDVDALVRDLGHPERPMQVSLSAAAEGVLDSLRVAGEGTLRGPEADLDLTARLAGADLQRLAPYLALVGVRPEADRLDASLRAEVRMAGTDDGAATGSIRIADVEVRADGEVEAGVEAVEATIARFAPASLHVERIGVEGVRARAERLADGTLRVAGLDLVGAPPSSDEDSADDDEAPRDEETGPPPALRVDLVEVAPVALALRDAAVPTRDGSANELELTVAARITEIVFGPDAGAAPIVAEITAEVDGAARLEIDANVGLPAADGAPLTARLGVRGDSITLEAVRPYLAAAGIEPTFEDGRFALDAEARILPLASGAPGDRIDATVERMRLSDGETTLAALGPVRVDGLELPADGDLRLAAVALEGVTLPVTLTEGGGFRAFGVASLGATDAAPEREVGVERGALTIAGLDLGAESARATIEGTLGLVQIAEEVRLSGSIETRSEPRDLRAEVTLDANALVFEALTPILGPAGITPTMDGGRLTATARAHLRGEGADALLDASAESVALVDGAGEELVALDRAALTGFALEPGDAQQPGTAEVAGVRARVERRADGVVVVAGLAFDGGPARAADGAAAEAAGGAGAAAPTVDASAPVNGDADGQGADDAGPPRAPLASVALEGVEISWRDAALAEPLALQLTAAGGLDWTESGSAVDLGGRLALAVPGIVGELALEPRVTQRTGGALEADVTLQGSGLSAGPAAAYAPPGVELLYDEGSLAARAAVRIGESPDGGRSIELDLTDLALVAAAGAEPSLELARLTVSVPRLDPDAGVYDIAEVVTEGVVATIAETAEGDEMRLEAFGVALSAAKPAEAAAPPTDDAAEAIDDDGGADPTAVAAAAPVSSRGAPTITLGRLDVGIDRLRYVDRTRAEDSPLDLRLHLTTPGPQTLIQPALEDLEPVRIALEGALAPLVSEIRLDVTSDLFSPTAHVEAHFDVAGIDGAALAEAAPDLAARVDLSEYRDGAFEAHADAALQIPRRGETGFQFGRGLTGLVKVGPVLVRPTPDAEPTGFQELVAEIARLSPVDGFVHLSTVDLGGIRGRVLRTAEGTRVAGVLLPAPPAEDDDRSALVQGPPAPAHLLEPERPDPNRAQGRAQDPGASANTGEFRVDLFTVHGVDFEYRDATTTPEFVLPIDDLSVEVQRFSTRTFEEPRPFTFRARVDAGEVEVPERTGADFLLFDVVGSAADAVTMAADEFEMEERRMWDLVEVTGRLSLAPELRGRIQATVLGLELPAFQGLTAGAGVDIGDGLIDTRAKVRFRDDGGLSLDTTTTATYLSISEPPDGPISKYLSLPAPLDTVLFLLRNDEGAQVLPVRLDVPPGGVSARRIAQLAAETLGLVISDAVASAPLRVLGPLKDIAGPLGLTSAPPTGETVALEFAPGAATVAASRRQGEGEAPADQPLAVLADALRLNTQLRVVLQAELGAGDIEVARRLGNPAPELLQSLLEAKRARKDEIDLERMRLSARVRAQLGIGATEEAERTAEELRVVAVERARVERAIDELFERIRPGADRRAEMRTRNAALALARERQDRVRRRLIDLAGPAAAERIDVRRPRYVPPGETEDGKELPERGVVTLTPR